MNTRCAGFATIETVVAAGLLAIAIGALGSAMLAQSRSIADGTIADALAATSRDEVRIAANALKYDGSTLLPASIATSMPMPVGSPIPITLSLALNNAADGSLAITVRAATSNAQGSLNRSSTLSLQRRMPLPGSEVLARSPVPAPLGAP